jgi:hypothetical protein
MQTAKIYIYFALPDRQPELQFERIPFDATRERVMAVRNRSIKSIKEKKGCAEEPKLR